MSICSAGLSAPCHGQPVTSEVAARHPRIQLGQVIPWPALAELVLPDLKQSTAKGKWWRGRKLKRRIPRGAFWLQWRYTLTDRQVEWGSKDKAAYQLGCGRGSGEQWPVPDHPKVEELRSRVSPETQRTLANEVAVWATALGLADPAKLDIDSTVQHATISYPAAAQLLGKLAQKCVKVVAFVKQAKKRYVSQELQIDLAAINRKAKEYFFLAKKTAIEKRREVLRAYPHLVKQQVKPVIAFCAARPPRAYAVLPWNIRRTIEQITGQGWRWGLDVAHFMRRHPIKPGKLWAFHCRAVACLRKGKVGKENAFGRVFQVGRIGGNFLLVGACTSLRMEDAAARCPLLGEHQRRLGEGTLRSGATAKSYSSAANRKYLRALPGREEVCLQQPGFDPATLAESERAPFTRLANRRAGIEPLIGHAKQGGQLGQSRMKHEASTLAAGYAAIGGFNLRHLVRHQLGKRINPMTSQGVENPNEAGTNLPTACSLTRQRVYISRQRLTNLCS
jgi:transposase, IS5 family